jgi:hypothetical protein
MIVWRRSSETIRRDRLRLTRRSFQFPQSALVCIGFEVKGSGLHARNYYESFAPKTKNRDSDNLRFQFFLFQSSPISEGIGIIVIEELFATTFFHHDGP